MQKLALIEAISCFPLAFSKTRTCTTDVQALLPILSTQLSTMATLDSRRRTIPLFLTKQHEKVKKRKQNKKKTACVTALQEVSQGCWNRQHLLYLHCMKQAVSLFIWDMRSQCPITVDSPRKHKFLACMWTTVQCLSSPSWAWEETKCTSQILQQARRCRKCKLASRVEKRDHSVFPFQLVLKNIPNSPTSHSWIM